MGRIKPAIRSCAEPTVCHRDSERHTQKERESVCVCVRLCVKEEGGKEAHLDLRRHRDGPLELPSLGIGEDFIVRVEVVVRSEGSGATETLIDEDPKRPV